MRKLRDAQIWKMMLAQCQNDIATWQSVCPVLHIKFSFIVINFFAYLHLMMKVLF